MLKGLRTRPTPWGAFDPSSGYAIEFGLDLGDAMKLNLEVARVLLNARRERSEFLARDRVVAAINAGYFRRHRGTFSLAVGANLDYSTAQRRLRWRDCFSRCLRTDSCRS